MMIRHGDLLLIPSILKKGEKSARDAHGRLVLLEGEVTGHAHVVTDADAEILVSREGAEELRLLVCGSPVSLIHEEHATILVPPGAYLIRRKVEYVSAFETRQVYD